MMISKGKRTSVKTVTGHVTEKCWFLRQSFRITDRDRYILCIRGARGTMRGAGCAPHSARESCLPLAEAFERLPLTLTNTSMILTNPHGGMSSSVDSQQWASARYRCSVTAENVYWSINQSVISLLHSWQTATGEHKYRHDWNIRW